VYTVCEKKTAVRGNDSGQGYAALAGGSASTE
jgi:hypothetical protein